MYTVHDGAEVRRLHEREHLSIAERFGMSRKTVHRLLELAEPPRYERPRRPSLLDGHVESIKAMLKDDPGVPATVMLEHLRREGYYGGIAILKDLLAEVRPLRVELARRELEQDILGLDRDLRRSGGGGHPCRPARPSRRDHHAQGRQLPAEGPEGRRRPGQTNRLSGVVNFQSSAKRIRVQSSSGGK